MQKCSAFPDKIQHPTREAALEHLKQLVFRNASVGQSADSRGLQVYECEACGSWHVGHAPVALVWHYAPATLLDTVLEKDVLPVPPPTAFLPIDQSTRRLGADTRHLSVPLGKAFLKRYATRLPNMVPVYVPEAGCRVPLSKDLLIVHPVLWFSRDSRWDYLMSTTPAMLIRRSSLELSGQGLVRFGVSPSLAPLRWADYQKMNPVSEEMSAQMEFTAEAGDWLASDADIPIDRIQRMEVYYQGAWTAVDAVDPDAFAEYLASRQAVYEEAQRSVVRKQAVAPDAKAPREMTRLLQLRPHMTLRKLIDWQIELLQLDEAERIVFEDQAIIDIREGRDEPDDPSQHE